LPRTNRKAFVWLIVWLLVAVSCGEGGPSAEERAASGGDATINDSSGNAFSFPIPSLSADERRAFFVGNSFFNDNWVTAPASTDGRDGLGPLFNAQSCSSCHFRDGRGQPPASVDDPVRGLLIRFSVPGESPEGSPLPEPIYGDQLQDRSILGIEPEGSIAIDYQDFEVVTRDGSVTLPLPEYAITQLAHGPMSPDLMMSPRIAPQLPGVGLLEAVPDDDIMALADPDDRDGDGISGRPNLVWDFLANEIRVGRFGWKANVPTLFQQNASAFLGDIGITSSLFSETNCTIVEVDCLEAPNGGSPEVDDLKLDRVTFYTRTLAVPARRDVEDPQVAEGEDLFAEIGCTSCHVANLTTGSSAIPELSNQLIHAYTDLLLHDMGPGLADGRPDFEASGQEWRTAPLWGIGLIETVNGHTRLLHDGRARSIEEAILWHGGEAEAARTGFTSLTDDQVDNLIAFLESL
jgi:CxxC motif-containing protein (DUF1111 family)